MGDIESLQTDNVAEPTMTDTPINPIDQLIREYSMGQIGPIQQEQQKSAVAPAPVGKDPREWNGFRETSNTISKDMQKKEMIQKEQEQTKKLQTISQGLVDEAQNILKETSLGKLDYNDAVTKLGSLQIKAQSVGLNQISDVIEGVAQKSVLKLAQFKEAQDARLAKRYDDSVPIENAKGQIDALKTELGNDMPTIDLITWDPDKKWVNKDQLETNIQTARAIAYMRKENATGIGGKSKDEVEKMAQNILNIKTKIANRSQTQRLSDKKAQAALDIQELVSAGATIPEAQSYVIKNVKKYYAFGEPVPQWDINQVLTPDQMKLVKESETSWQPVRDWFANKKNAKAPGGKPAGNATKVVNGVTYTKGADGLWHKTK